MKKIAFLFIVLFFAQALTGCAKQTDNTGSIDKTTNSVVASTSEQTDFPLQELRQASISIDGMWCASCAVGIEYVLKSKEGVVDADIGFGADLEGIGEVIYHPALISKEEIVQSAEPYTAVIVSDKKATAKSLN